MAVPDRDDVDLYDYHFPSPLPRARRDLRQAAATLSVQEVRYLVDMYYEIQRYRIASGNQERALDENEEPTSLLGWTNDAFTTVEDEIRKGLDVYSMREPTGVGAWCRSIVGIGPVIAAGLLAHLDITRASTVGHYWRFAGLDPTVTWNKSEKRPWNASLKVLTWKLGESFVKVSNHPRDVYGKLYVGRKVFEINRDTDGGHAEQAAAMLAAKRFGRDTVARAAYESGHLPPGHLHARAKRFAVKQFLADLHHVQYEQHYGTLPPFPYPIAYLGHAHERGVPNHECIGR